MEATDLFTAQDFVAATAVEAPSSSPVLAVRRVILGVDPGASGAIAFYRPDRPAEIEVYDVPLVDKMIDAAQVAHLIRTAGATEAMIERVGAMPKQGVSSTFKFGMAYGAVLGIVAAMGVPIRQATPGRWKAHFRLSADKEQARGLAVRQWPSSRDFSLKKHHGRAEAALLALYAVEVVR